MSEDKSATMANGLEKVEARSSENITEKSKPAPMKDKKQAASKKEGKKEGKPKEETKGEDEDKVVEEKMLTINLRHAYLTYGRKAAPKAVHLVEKVSSKIFKAEEGVKIDNRLNEKLWSRGKTKTERRITVRVQKLESGTVRVLPAEA